MAVEATLSATVIVSGTNTTTLETGVLSNRQPIIIINKEDFDKALKKAGEVLKQSEPGRLSRE